MGLIDRIDFKSSLGFDRIKEYVQGKDGPEKKHVRCGFRMIFMGSVGGTLT